MAGMNLGALLIGTQVYCLLWGIYLSQAGSYFSRYRNDPLGLKLAVLAVTILETSYIFVLCAAVYHHIISLFGSPLAGIPSILFALTSTPNAISMFIVNIFLISRYFRLAKKWWLSILLGLLALTSFAAQFWAIGVFVQRLKGLPAAGFNQAPTVSLASEAVVVSIVAALLVLHLLKFVKTDVEDTRRLLTKIIIVTIETGLATTTLAIVTLIVFKTEPDSAISIVIGGCTGRVAALTMIYNLNMRGSGGHLMNTSSNHHASIPPQSFALSGVRSTNNGGTTSKLDTGIAVHQTMRVQIDDARLDRDSKEAGDFDPTYKESI